MPATRRRDVSLPPDLPQWFVNEAQGIPADEHYCMHMLEQHLLGTRHRLSSSDAWYFQTTFLPQMDDLREIMPRVVDAHNKLMAK